MVKILAIETSCDETAAAVLDASIPRGFSRVLSNCVSSQMKLHQPYFGVVPELASRAHLEKIPWVVGRALKKSGVQRCDAVAYTRGPGLAGALLVGKVAAETLAFMWRVPLIPVHHLEGHALALGLTEPIRFPFLALIVSGGHTDLVLMSDYGRVRVLGRTRDDAAGEAFDKVAKLLRLGYPGGPLIDRLAREGNPEAIQFPRALLKGSWDFSFSGLKTSVLYYLMDRSSELRVKSSEVVNLKSSTLNSQLLTPNSFVKDVCASFQEAVVDTL
ncbi:MAG: tRNA (adenosine(37)-N6)-threonylcarbamoyltransferase complex transferase subunit TsaD, partial [Elusimicrobia bacterium]|nr:tRNA (adenosine(37)-N6)-threonylcarbamoyltransferase complex transferase subunit TsaD [Elusimicrobiota bacterium]